MLNESELELKINSFCKNTAYANNSSNNLSTIFIQDNQPNIVENKEIKDKEISVKGDFSEINQNKDFSSKRNKVDKIERVNFSKQSEKNNITPLVIKNQTQDFYVTYSDSLDKYPKKESKNLGADLIRRIEKKIYIKRKESAPNKLINSKSNSITQNILNEVYENCTNNIKLSSKLDSIIIKNKTRLNKSIEISSIKKDNKSETNEIIKDSSKDKKKHSIRTNAVRSIKEKLQERYIKLLEDEAKVKNIDLLGKISDKMAMEFRKELIRKFKYNYKYDKDYIFDDSFLDKENDHESYKIGKGVIREKSKFQFENHEKVEYYLNNTLRVKEKLINQLDFSLPIDRNRHNSFIKKKYNKSSNQSSYIFYGDKKDLNNKLDKGAEDLNQDLNEINNTKITYTKIETIKANLKKYKKLKYTNCKNFVNQTKDSQLPDVI